MKAVLITFIIIILAGLMNNTPAQNPKVIVTAHRGASAYAPENTIASFVEAINMKADYAELDVQETSDGELILFHDKHMKRTAGLDKDVWEASYDEVKNLDAGSWFNEKYKGEKIPKFADVIDFVKGKIKLNIELKTNGHEKALADRVVKIVKDKGFENQCIITSFDYNLVKRVKEIAPSLKVGLIFKTIPDSIDVFKINAELLSVHFSVVNEEFVKKAKENGKEVHVWTANEESEMKRLIGLGVNSLITNYPDIARRIVDESVR